MTDVSKKKLPLEPELLPNASPPPSFCAEASGVPVEGVRQKNSFVELMKGPIEPQAGLATVHERPVFAADVRARR